MIPKQNRIRIGLLANSFVVGRGELSGGFIHLLEVARRWRSYDVVVFAPEQARNAIAELLPDATFVPALPRIASRLEILPYANIATRLLGTWLNREAYAACDILLASTTFLADVLPSIFAKPNRTAIIVQHLQTPPWLRRGNLAGNVAAFTTERLGLLIGRRRVGLVFFNDFKVAMKSGLVRKNVRAVRITHGVDHIRSFPNYGSLSERRDALFVGRIHPTKGLDDLIDSWRAVVDHRPGTKLRLVGTGTAQYRESLARRIERQKLQDDVLFLGPVNDSEKCSQLRAARVFVFPSLEEGWGIALAEAMAFGTPCVTYDLEAYTDVFVTGRIAVPTNDTNSLSTAVLRLFEDDGLWETLSKQATELAEHFTWARAADVYSRAIDDLLANDNDVRHTK